MAVKPTDPVRRTLDELSTIMEEEGVSLDESETRLGELRSQVERLLPRSMLMEALDAIRQHEHDAEGNAAQVAVYNALQDSEKILIQADAALELFENLVSAAESVLRSTLMTWDRTTKEKNP